MRLWLQILQGNNEKDKVVTNDLNPAIPMARFIRIHPKTWQTHISLRFEVLGCEVTGNHILHQDLHSSIITYTPYYYINQ